MRLSRRIPSLVSGLICWFVGFSDFFFFCVTSQGVYPEGQYLVRYEGLHAGY